MAGSSSRVNSTSMTAPMHWTIVPSLACLPAVASFMNVSSNSLYRPSPSNRRGPADNLGELLGDAGLTCLVVDHLQLIDDRRGVVGGGLHRDHASALFRGHVLGHGLVDHRLDVAHQEPVEDGPRIGLVDVVPGVLALILFESEIG